MKKRKIVGDTAIVRAHHHRDTTAFGLTDDLLVEIFSRLPVKSLYRFACASKAWKSIITKNDYYRRKLPSPLSLFYRAYYIDDSALGYKYVCTSVHDEEGSSSIDISTALSFLPPHPKLKVLSSCNGLILCSNFEKYSKPDKCLYVCNPATKKYDKIPLPTCYCPLSLAFDPCISPHYKVAAISFSYGKVDYMEVLSSETGEWLKYKDCMRLVQPVSLYPYSSSVFVRGNIHLLASSFIVGVDIENKACREIEIPPTNDNSQSFLEKFEGSLRIAHDTRDEILVWDLTDYDANQWRLKYKVSKHNMNSFVPLSHDRLWHKFEMAALHPYSNVIFMVIRDTLFSYNFITSNLTEVCTLRGKNQVFSHTCTTCYTGCLGL